MLDNLCKELIRLSALVKSGGEEWADRGSERFTGDESKIGKQENVQRYTYLLNCEPPSRRTALGVAACNRVRFRSAGNNIPVR